MQQNHKMLKINYCIFYFLFFIFYFLLFTSCNSDYQPKPKGYFRIDLQKKAYLKFDAGYPYSFEYPVYSNILPDTEKNAEPYWINIDFPKYKGKIHISYKFVKNNLNKYLEDSRNLVMKHIEKATSIDERIINNHNNKVYGLAYNIRGTGAASSYQFYLTDSTSNFLRGALYFYLVPNNDSLAPVIEYIKQDIDHLIKTFKWKPEVKNKK
jgi:gliding motility-associated lipoprotein GldD